MNYKMFHIVDDQAVLLEVLQEFLECEGYEVMAFHSGEAYLEYLHSPEFIEPIAILSDYEMGGVTGLDMIKQVRQKIPAQKAIIISGTPSSELNASIHTYLCYFLAKPYDFDKLFLLLKSLDQCNQSCKSSANLKGHNCEYGLKHPCPFRTGLPK
ncbi:MAG: response regulator [Mariprofundaceae bacterium]